MVDQPAPGDRRPKILIPDNTPLTLLGSIKALDWLFVPGCEVWMTDMVIEEALREPGDDKDQRNEARSYVRSWVHINRHRIKRVTTATGAKYQEDMAEYQQNLRNWETRWRRAAAPKMGRPW